jgi:hypothetical protein
LPQLALEQQTPSTQKPLSQSVLPLQVCPSRRWPHEPRMQGVPAAQSASVAQADVQDEPLHV